jgi:DNA adenine methylase
MMNEKTLPRPFLKWAGGKTQLTDELLARMPVDFHTYHEPFVGSGALFFRLYREQKIKHAILSDINAELIDTYIAIRDAVAEVIRLLAEFPHEKKFYYALREKDPWSMTISERAARMIYLNKTGYNGLYRVNRQGRFNVPFGRYKSPRYLDKDNLLAVSRALGNVEILCTSFEAVIERAKPGDWVYFDPPYVPLSQTSHFTSYHADGFRLHDQERLRDICMELSQKNVYITLSNSDTAFIRSLYDLSHFAIDEVLANRAINCNGAKRGKVTELVITNYPVERAVQLRPLEQQLPYLVLQEHPPTHAST